jgi:WD40 repeat protein
MQGLSSQRAPLFHIKGMSKDTHKASATCVDWYQHDNGLFMSGAKDSTARLWDPNRASLIRSVNVGEQVLALAMAPAASAEARAVVACAGGKVHMIDVLACSITQSLAGALCSCLAQLQ